VTLDRTALQEVVTWLLRGSCRRKLTVLEKQP
jgi:hypothetical protein